MLSLHEQGHSETNTRAFRVGAHGVRGGGFLQEGMGLWECHVAVVRGHLLAPGRGKNRTEAVSGGRPSAGPESVEDVALTLSTKASRRRCS